MSDFTDRFIADLIKGAESSEGFIPGSRVAVEVAREARGREEKLAADASTYLGGIPVAGPGLAGLNASARDGSMSSGFLTGAGAGVGQYGGAALGSMLGNRLSKYLADRFDLNEEDAQLLGMGLGGLGGTIGGGMLGAAGGRALGEPTKQGSLQDTYQEGVHAALEGFGVKEAFLGAIAPAVGSALGGTVAKAGLGALAGQARNRGLRGMAGRAAETVLSKTQKGMGAAAFDNAASMAGGALGQRLAPGES